MTKKIFWTTILGLIFILAFSTISFAKSDNTTTKLGNEVTSSMNKTERSMNDLVDKTNLDKAGQTIENGARAVGNAVNNGMDDIGRGIEDLTDENGNEMRTENRAVVGTTGNYTTEQTQIGNGDQTTRNGMTQNAWIWIVLIVVSLIIVAAVWYYAAQKQ